MPRERLTPRSGRGRCARISQRLFLCEDKGDNVYDRHLKEY
jgi:hypothetical protein